MGRFVVLGAGAVGQGTARELAGAGHTVQIVSRSGRGPQVEGVTAVAADAADVERLTQLASGTAAIDWMLGSQGCLATESTRALSLRSGCLVIH